MAGMWAAFRSAREQQRKIKDYEKFVKQPMSERLLEHVQHVCDRTGAPVIIRMQTGAVIEMRPRASAQNTRFKDRLQVEGTELTAVLEEMQKTMQTGLRGVGIE